MAQTNGIAGEILRSMVDRIERLEAEKATLAEDVKEIYIEAKSHGLDPKIIRKVIAIRKKDKADLAEEQILLGIYLDALGDLASTPLGQSALTRAGLRADA